jgi:hypothetical protein
LTIRQVDSRFLLLDHVKVELFWFGIEEFRTDLKTKTNHGNANV